MNDRQLKLEKEMDKALHFVASSLKESGHNPKPVLLHSFKVGMILYQEDYAEDIVLAGILHDLIEDTQITLDIIQKEFNDQISKIVLAVSFDPNITDKYLQAEKMFLNCLNYGYDALIVKCADLLDNINYVSYSNDKEELLKKYLLFLNISKDVIGSENIYKKLEQKYNELI